MTCQYILLGDGRMVQLTGWGSIGVEETEQAFRDFLADPRLQEHFGLLVDARNASPSPSAAGVHSLAEIHSRLLGFRARRTALVVGNTEQFGVGRMFQILADLRGAEVAVFKDEGDALEWLERGFEGDAGNRSGP